MVLHIEDPEADRLARELAARTGEPIDRAVIVSLRNTLAMQDRKADDLEKFVADVMEIGRRCASLPLLDTRSADEIIGYDENGAPA